MREPRRLLARGGTKLERALLESWGSESPRPEARTKALAALGIGTGIAGAATTSAGTASAAVASKALITGAVSALKWAGVVAIAVSTTVAVVYAPGPSHVDERAAAPRVTPSPPAPRPSPLRAAEPSKPVASATTTTVTEEGAPVLPAAPRVPVSAPKPVASAVAPPSSEPVPSALASVAAPPVASSTPPASTLNQEIVALDRARSAFAAGDGAEALRRLDEYDRSFPRGLLAQEAFVLRIDTLERLGRTSEASALAARFVRTYPSSPVAARLRALAER